MVTISMQRTNLANNWLKAVNYYHKALHLGCCSCPRSASGITVKRFGMLFKSKNKVYFILYIILYILLYYYIILLYYIICF